jgi:hypothetical protein
MEAETNATEFSAGDIKAGDRVFYKPEWMDPGDENQVFLAMEDYDGSGRIAVVAANTGLFLDPWSIVGIHMIERIERPKA